MPSNINEAISSNAGFTQRDYDNSLRLYKQYVDGVLRLELASSDQIEKIQKKLYKGRRDLSEEEIERSEKIAIRYQNQRYKHMSFLEKKSADEKEKNEIELYKQQLANANALKEAEIEAANMAAEEKKKALKEAHDEYMKQLNEVAETENENKKRLARYEKIAYDRLSARDKLQVSIDKRKEKFNKAQEATDKASYKLLELQEKRAADKGSVSDEEMQKAEEDVAKAKKEEQAAQVNLFGAQMAANLSKSIGNAIGNAMSKMTNEVSSAMNLIVEHQSSISTRLLGTNLSYARMTGAIKSNLAVSPWVTQKATLENLAKLVDSGVAYNVEQRAFLATISDKIATTFDAFDSNLTRLIRLQQADITASRLGIEAALNSQLNAMFSDTSYLKDMYTTISGALVDAESQMTREQAAEFQYTVQKYLGALYSLGMSQSAVSQIATGIGYLGTGNIEALSGNSQLMSLMGMSASRGGVDLGSLLTGGVTGDNANKLMKGMIEYLREIATSTENMATKSAYGSVFGLGVSDLRALANLTATDITNLYESNMTYESSIQTLNTLLGSVWQRMNISEMASNVFSNAMFSSGQSIVNNPGLYLPWLVTSTIKDLTGGTAIPAIAGFDVNNTVEGLMQTALVGMGLMQSLPRMFMSLGRKGGLNLGAWGGSEFTVRGSGWKGIAGGTESGVSMSAYVGGSGEDIQSDVVKKAKEEAKTQASDTDTKDTNDLYNALFGGDGQDRKAILVEISGITSGVQIPVTVENTDTNPINVVSSFR